MSREKLDVDLQESRSKNSPKTSNNPFDIVRSLKIENYSDETDKMVQQQQQRESMTKKEYKSLQILNEEMRKLDRGTCLMTMLEPDSTLAIKQNAEVIQQHLQLLFSDQKLCDLIIRNDEKQYNIHSIILMMHSDKYKTIFMDAANSPPTEIPLVEISCKIIEKLIHYMYTFKIVIDDESIDEILNVSHQLDMKILIQKCVEHLRQYNMSNCLKYFMISKKYNLGELSSQYLDFAKSNFIHISKLPEFLMLDADDIRSLIGMFKTLLVFLQLSVGQKNRLV